MVLISYLRNNCITHCITHCYLLPYSTLLLLQVAEVIGTLISRPDLAENKCLEVVADTDAPLTDMEALLEGVAQEVGQQERIAANAAVVAARNKVW